MGETGSELEITDRVFIKESSWDQYEGKGENRAGEQREGLELQWGPPWSLQPSLHRALHPEWPR